MQRANSSIRNLLFDLGKKATATRSMSFLHAGHLQKRVKAQSTDTTGQHKIVSHTTCNDTKCMQINCADKNSIEKCPYTKTLNALQFPASDTKATFETKIIGNVTSKIPYGKEGFTINTSRNYTGQNKRQEMVTEVTSISIEVKDLTVDMKATTFVQEPKHHITIINNITKP